MHAGEGSCIIEPMTSATSRRLFWSFGSLVLLLAVASYFAIAASAKLHHALHGLKNEEEAIRLTFELGDAVRAERAGEEGPARAHAARQALLTHVDEPRDQREIATIADAPNPTEAMARARALARRLEAASGDFEAHGATVQHAMFRWMLILLAASILFAIVVAVYIGRSVTQPLARLRAGAERLGGGDLSTRVHIDSRDEFEQLARSFNAMAVSLQEHQARLVEQETLASIGRVVAGAAHELNNPLGVILGYVRLLARAADGAEAQDLKIVEEEAVRCQHIVEDLLDLARPKSAADALVDLRACCQSIVERLARAEHWQVEVAIDGQGFVRGDQAKVAQIIANLVRNAVEAAGSAGKVSITVRQRDQFVELIVRDSGLGVPESVRARLFEPFFTTKPAGTGLGLAVSQAIARSHRGEIIVGNAAGGGAVFTLRLPSADTQARP